MGVFGPEAHRYIQTEEKVRRLEDACTEQRKIIASLRQTVDKLLKVNRSATTENRKLREELGEQ